MCIGCGNPFHAANAIDGTVSSASPASHLDPIQAGAQITRHNYHWGTTLGAAVGPISFGFRASAPTYNSTSNEQGTFSQFTPQEMAAAEYAMRMWANLANISFSEVNPGDYTNNATILFGNYFSTTDNTQSFTYFPSSNNQSATSSQGDVWLNTNYESTTSLGAGSYDLMTVLHEVGHALGLEHPGTYDNVSGQPITYANSAQYVEDSQQYTVMSYFNASNTGADHVYAGHTIYASTPLLDDITAIQRLYGANTSYAIGNTTYGFHSNADAAFQLASSTQQVVFTIWDGGGNDTLDFSGYSTNQIIDLLPGTFSSVGALTLNVSIALGTIVENVLGGSGSDIIYENSANNIINGGSGADTLVFAGTHSQYQAALNPDGSLTLVDVRASSPDGTDTAISIEYFQFSDGTYTSGQLDYAPAAGNTVSGGPDADILRGTSGSDELAGGAGNDILIGLGGSDILNGEDGTDTADYSASDSRVVVNLTTGYAAGGHAQGDTLINVENLIGSAFSNDILTGNSLDNVLAGLAGADTLDGQGGNDTADYSASDGRVVVNLATGYAAGGHAQGDTLIDVENLSGSAFSNDILTGNSLDNVLAGLAGADTLDGQGGNDTADYSVSDGRVVVNLATGYAAGGHAQGDTLINVENLIGSAFSNDILTGNSLDNVLAGLAGADTLDGQGGNDTADYSASDNRVVVNLTTGYAAGGFAHGDTLVSIENLIGTQFANDILTGNSLDNVLAGLAGADTLDGQGGNDTADYSASDNRVVVNLTTGYAAGGHAQGDTLISIENIIGTAFEGDILFSNLAANVLTGGAGGDTFVFQGAFNTDTVTDYQHGVDALDVAGAGGLVSSIDTADGALYTFSNGSSVLLLHETVAHTSGDFFVS